MVDAGYVTQRGRRPRDSHEPLVIVQRALEAEAPYFVDFVGQTLAEQYPGLTTTTTQAVDVYTTLDLHLQRLAQDAVRDGLTQVDSLLAKRKRGKAEAALISVDPRTGEILAFVGGRSYNQSQYNRADRRAASAGVGLQAVRVPRGVRAGARAEGRTDVTPASITNDEQETFEFDDQVWTPENYEHEYDGPITFRRALAHSRNLGTIHVAQQAGYDRVAAFWKTPGRRHAAEGLPVDRARRLRSDAATKSRPRTRCSRTAAASGRCSTFSQNRQRRQGRARRRAPSWRERSSQAGHDLPRHQHDAQRLERGHCRERARDRASRSTPPARPGTTNDLRDAWFVGFTPELLTVVWVGFDDNQPVGLSGARAALPIWTQFMKTALAGTGQRAVRRAGWDRVRRHRRGDRQARHVVCARR